MTDILTFTDAGKILGVAPAVVSALVKTHGLQPKPVPRNGKAKGLDRADMRVLRKALGLHASRERMAAQP